MNKTGILLLSVFMLLMACNNQSKPLTCEEVAQNKTLENAVFSFEKDAGTYLKSNKERSNVFFLRFLLRYSNGNLDFSEMVTNHTIEALKELKNIPELYNIKGNTLTFNYQSSVYKCLLEEFPNEVKTVFNQLENSGYLNSEFTAKALQSQDHSIVENNAIKTYIILAIYYPTVVNNSEKKPINLTL